jgi:hypothetical protein
MASWCIKLPKMSSVLLWCCNTLASMFLVRSCLITYWVTRRSEEWKDWESSLTYFLTCGLEV